MTILIADDHPLFRQALAVATGRVAPGARVVEAGTLASAVRQVGEIEDLALILLDLKMPGAVGYSGIALLHAERPEVPILVVSSAEGEGAANEVRSFGAVGFINKNGELRAIESAIAAALHGRRMPAPPHDTSPEQTVRDTVAGLTPSELKILLAVVEGQLNKQIAFNLGISEGTVKGHMTSIMRKLDVSNRTQAALVARSLGIDLAH